VAGSKRGRDEGEPLRLSLATALPLSVWQDHLAPYLSRVEAVRLRVVCKALTGVVHECPVGVGVVRADMLTDALTCFPAAPSLDIIFKRKLAAARQPKLVELLRRHGGTLKRVAAEGGGAEQLLYSAVRAGALPKLTYFKMKISDPEHRQWLSDGRLRLLEEVHVKLLDAADFPALGHLQQLPQLRSLEIEGEQAPMPEAVFPAFIPPSLKTLTLDRLHGPLLESLLLQLPPMLQASGTSLEELQVIPALQISDESGASLARVLQLCSATLKRFSLICATNLRVFELTFASEVALGLESCCEGLERLEVPWAVFESLPPTCTTFKRLAHLHLYTSYYGAMGLIRPMWVRVANGLLPALADLSVDAQDLMWPSAEKKRSLQLTRALEGVAGTLTRLTLQTRSLVKVPPAADCRQLGVAIGKLRRLCHLSLHLAEDGQCYQDVGRGMAASGGCPRLRELHVTGVKRNKDRLAYKPSLIVPSVRSLHIAGGGRGEEGEDALALSCGLVQMGYKHRLITKLNVDQKYGCCVTAILKAGGIHADA
jgi:hypothetical protein